MLRLLLVCIETTRHCVDDGRWLVVVVTGAGPGLEPTPRLQSNGTRRLPTGAASGLWYGVQSTGVRGT
jgi:hypothetical protein